MSDLIKQIQYKGNTINIYQDTMAESPDDWKNEDIFIVYDHRSFTISRDGFSVTDIGEAYSSGQRSFNGFHILPLFAYIHSGIVLSTSDSFNDKWDVSFAGFVLVEINDYWPDRESAKKSADSIVNEWNLYLSGQVYYYRCDSHSCGGFYGDNGLEEAINEAKNTIDCDENYKLKKHFNILKSYIKAKVSFQYRLPSPLF